MTEPEATFSACFGGAFLMWHPMKYASMLAEKMGQHGTTAWLVNTGCAAGRRTYMCVYVFTRPCWPRQWASTHHRLAGLHWVCCWQVYQCV